jgi:hypothetical protein
MGRAVAQTTAALSRLGREHNWLGESPQWGSASTYRGVPSELAASSRNVVNSIRTTLGNIAIRWGAGGRGKALLDAMRLPEADLLKGPCRSPELLTPGCGRRSACHGRSR